jgi:hypothetical protein
MPAVTMDIRTIWGNKRAHVGHFTPSSTGGDINVGLHRCEQIFFTAVHDTVHADAIAVNETMPCRGNAITVVHSDGPGGLIYFLALGH